MSSPTDRRYMRSHEWHRLDGEVITIGLTQYAVDELTDVTYIDLPQAGAAFNAGDVIGEIESVKATSELYTGVSGQVVETNQAVIDNPVLVNTNPFDTGWLIKIKPTDPAQLDQLMDAAAYDATLPNE